MDAKNAFEKYKKYKSEIEKLREVIATELLKEVENVKENKNIKLISKSPTIYTINSKTLDGNSWNIEYYSNTILSRKLIEFISNKSLDQIIETLLEIKDKGEFGKSAKKIKCNNDFRNKISKILKKIES